MEENGSIIIQEVMDLANISELYDACQAALASGAAEVKIDASKVERAKTPIFQLLLVLKKSLENDNRKLIIEAPTEAFRNMAACIGLQEALS